MSIYRGRLITIVILVLGSYFVFSLSKGTYDLWYKAEKVKEAQDERKEKEEKNRQLKKQLEFVQKPEFIEKQAREKLGLAKPNEVVVVMTTPEATQSGIEKDLPNWEKWWNLFF